MTKATKKDPLLVTTKWLLESTETDRNVELFYYRKNNGVRRTSGPCHFCTNEIPPGTEVLLNRLQSIDSYRVEPNIKNYDRYLHWLANESVFAPAFLSKDVDWMVSHHCTNMDVDKPANFVTAAMIATRLLWENYGLLDLWIRLIDELGVEDPNFALAATGRISSLRKHPEHGSIFSVNFAHKGDHHPFSGPGMSNEGIRNMVRGVYLKDSESLRDGLGYSCVTGAWGPTVGRDRCELSKLLKNHIKLQEFGGRNFKDKNPWGSSHRMPSRFSVLDVPTLNETVQREFKQ